MTVIRGSCVGSTIKFEIEKVAALTHSHYSVCRKESGASFATYAHVRRERFKFLSSEDFIDPGYEWTPGAEIHRGKQNGQRSSRAV